jgi:hypothetical protein
MTLQTNHDISNLALRLSFTPMPTRGPVNLACTHQHSLFGFLLVLLSPHSSHPFLLSAIPLPAYHPHRTRFKLDLHPPFERNVERPGLEGIVTYETGGHYGSCSRRVGGQGINCPLGRGDMAG